MTVASTAVVVNGPYVPNGLTTDFPFTFAVVASTDLSVDLDGSTLSPNLYTVTVNEGGGGTVHMLSAPVGSELFVYLNPDFGQQANFESGGPFLASVVEESYDKGVLRDQYLRGQIEQTIRVPLGDTPPTYAELLDMLAGSTGAPGGNVMSIGTFIGASGMGIGAGTDLVQTTGYSTAGSGAALYVYDAAVDAAYVAAHPRAAFIAAGGRGFRLDERQVLNVMMFGAVANDPGVGAFGTDDYPAFAAGFDYCQHRAIAGYINGTIYRGGLAFRIPKGGYYSSGSLVPLFSGKLFGDGGKGWGAATRIRFAAGVDGIQLQAHNTSGKTTLDGVTHFAGDRLHIADIAFIGAYTGTESDTHGDRKSVV